MQSRNAAHMMKFLSESLQVFLSHESIRWAKIRLIQLRHWHLFNSDKIIFTTLTIEFSIIIISIPLP